MNWQPTANLESLNRRAAILQQIRLFFAERQVLEVETPALSHATVTDEHLHCFETHYVGPGAAEGKKLYLQTSPEYAMKRLLCAGSGCIYQISKAFRNEESGRYHNPEFTMLEWYRLGFDHFQLMDEVDQLLQLILGSAAAELLTYQQAFQLHLKLDPLTASLDTLRKLATDKGLVDIAATETDKDTLLQLLFSLHVEPYIGQERPCIIYHFPASQAALARIHQDDPRVAERFEVYFKGIELANGFHELSDVLEQKQRFELDNQKRLDVGRPQRQMDNLFLSALEFGLPDCAGVALGIDRLVMLALGATQLQQIVAFPIDRS